MATTHAADRSTWLCAQRLPLLGAPPLAVLILARGLVELQEESGAHGVRRGASFDNKECAANECWAPGVGGLALNIRTISGAIFN